AARSLAGAAGIHTVLAELKPRHGSQGLAYTRSNAGPIRVRAESPSVTRKRAFLNHATASGLRTRSFIDHETSARKPPRNCKVGGEKARRKEDCPHWTAYFRSRMNQPQISCPQISQMNADGKNHRGNPLHGSIGGFSNP